MRKLSLAALLIVLTASCQLSSEVEHTRRGAITDITVLNPDSTAVSALYHPVEGANNRAYVFVEDESGAIAQLGVRIPDDGPSLVSAFIAPPVGYRLRLALLLTRSPDGGKVLEVAADTSLVWGEASTSDEDEGTSF